MTGRGDDSSPHVSWLITGAVCLVIAVSGCGRPSLHHGQSGLPAPPEVFNNPYMVPDDVVGHFHKPDLSLVRPWREHPGHQFVFTTNNLGFVNAHDTSLHPPPETVRVLLTGDSHVEGVVNVDENVAAVLEALLAAKGRRVEVLNAGVGYYTPHHYAAVLEKFASLEPDWFVVVFYTGNDFIGALQAEEYLGRLHLPDRSQDYLERLKRAEEVASAGGWLAGAIYQGLNQVFYFTRYPESRGVALAATERQFEKIKEGCRQRGIKLLVVMLPTKIDVEYETDAEHLDTILGVLGLDTSDLQITLDLTDELVTWLRHEDVRVLDLLGSFRSSPDELFWREDYHLSVKGHRLLADELSRVLLETPAHPPGPASSEGTEP